MDSIRQKIEALSQVTEIWKIFVEKTSNLLEDNVKNKATLEQLKAKSDNISSFLDSIRDKAPDEPYLQKMFMEANQHLETLGADIRLRAGALTNMQLLLSGTIEPTFDNMMESMQQLELSFRVIDELLSGNEDMTVAVTTLRSSVRQLTGNVDKTGYPENTGEAEKPKLDLSANSSMENHAGLSPNSSHNPVLHLPNTLAEKTGDPENIGVAEKTGQDLSANSSIQNHAGLPPNSSRKRGLDKPHTLEGDSDKPPKAKKSPGLNNCDLCNSDVQSFAEEKFTMVSYNSIYYYLLSFIDKVYH